MVLRSNLSRFSPRDLLRDQLLSSPRRSPFLSRITRYRWLKSKREIRENSKIFGLVAIFPRMDMTLAAPLDSVGKKRGAR